MRLQTRFEFGKYSRTSWVRIDRQSLGILGISREGEIKKAGQFGAQVLLLDFDILQDEHSFRYPSAA